MLPQRKEALERWGYFVETLIFNNSAFVPAVHQTAVSVNCATTQHDAFNQEAQPL